MDRIVAEERGFRTRLGSATATEHGIPVASVDAIIPDHLGNGGTTNESAPVQVEGLGGSGVLSDVTAIAAGMG